MVIGGQREGGYCGRWLIVVAGGRGWLVVMAGGVRWLVVVSGGGKWWRV